jgi:2-hydroxy-3-keto-5-methylthiopentenyl-1-phosphate phosphatase
MMFTHMLNVKNEKHQAHGNTYELSVYQVQETGQYRIYISKAGDTVGDIFTALQEDVLDVAQSKSADLIEEIISVAKSDIDRNEYNLY